MISIRNVRKDFVKGDVKQLVLKNINLSIADGDFVTIMGPSGGGKSTLLYLLALLDTPTTGDICIDNNNMGKLSEKAIEAFRGKNIGLIFQNANLISALTPLENLIIAMKDKSSYREKKRKGESLLEKVGLQHKKNSNSASLSGGEAQRVAVVRALVNNPRIILCDEPTGALDSVNSKRVIELLMNIRKETGCTLIIVTHDKDIGALGERKIILKDGEISELS
ncbi:ABC transporter ATP-binding protein [Clostridium oryzae]|uniref:Lipoprotein-releasing system ATP-binding protein LolD n=1 Tax=Clostridium oryzae TaxID=1450648 RepID=A0A1V4ILG4_9CLOT|nr:ABC transporter ATP-binding protein [Clostridium oryzae]OPJ60743.1 lipoprotein-releasing system ATP-binding protein LolD [Clostridium oryzae]